MLKLSYTIDEPWAPIASTVGRGIDPLPFLTGASPHEATREQVEQAATTMGLREGDDLALHVGGTAPLSDIWRTWHNPDSSLVRKIIAPVGVPIGSTLVSMLRADHFNPDARSITLFHKDPAIQYHEIGHYLDYSKNPRFVTHNYHVDPTWHEAQASQAAYKNLESKRQKDMLLKAFGTYQKGIPGSEAGLTHADLDQWFSSGYTDKMKQKSIAKLRKDYGKTTFWDHVFGTPQSFIPSPEEWAARREASIAKTSSLTSSTAKIVLANPERYGLDTTLTRHELQAKARELVTSGKHPRLATLKPAIDAETRPKVFGNYVFRATDSTPHGTSNKTLGGLSDEAIPPDALRNDLLWGSAQPNIEFGKNMWATDLGKTKPVFTGYDMSSASALHRLAADNIGREQVEFGGRIKDLGGMDAVREVNEKLGPNAPNRIVALQAAERGFPEELSKLVDEHNVRSGKPAETILPRSDYPETVFKKVTKDETGTWKDPDGRPVFGDPRKVTNKDFYKKWAAASW